MRNSLRLALLLATLATPLLLAPTTSAGPPDDKPGLAKPKPTATATPGAGGTAGIAKPASSAVGFVPTGKLASGLESLEKSDYAAAEKDLKAVTGKDAARATIGLARIAIDTGKYADGESLAKKAVGLAGADVAVKTDAVGWQAAALLAVGKVDEAIKICEPYRDEVKAARARAALVEALVRKGDRDEARNVADALEADSEGDDVVYKDPGALASVGRAAHAVRHIKYANSTFKEAMRLQKKHVETNIAWAKLFLDYYDPGHAEESVRDVLAVAPNNPIGHVLRAEVKLAQMLDWETAEKELVLAEKVNPKLPRVWFIRASMTLHDLEIKQSDDSVAKGLAIDPNDLDLLALKAAIRFLDDDMPGYEKAKADAFKRNPKFSRFFITVGEFADWEHRYDDLVTMMKEATKLDPTDGKAWADLGFNLLRRGDETEGLAALDTAYKHDKYNVRLVNMLNLFEKTLSKKYDLADGTGTAKYFKFRLEKEEAPLLGQYVPRTMAQAWATMVKKYGFTPNNPVQIEIFPEREHFSVRTDGVPNLGPTGVCFGRLITAVSPKKEASNWGLVLWHELGHVFAIQLSKNHVPRWFTEGLSEYETIVTRPEWHRALDPQLYVAMKGGRIPKVAEMNRAFTHAKSQRDVIVAYYASSQMIIYIADTYGFPKIVNMLKLWGQGKKSVEVIKTGLGVTPDALDSDFKAWLKKRLSRYDGQFVFDAEGVPETEDAQKASDAAPKDADKMATLAAALFLDKKLKEADSAAQKAIALDGKQQVARYIAAKLAFGLRKDPVEAKTHVNAIVTAGGDGYVVQNMLADIAEATKDKKAMRAALEKAATFDPSQIDPLVDLYLIAEQEKREDDMMVLLRKMVKMDPHERIPWKKLLENLAKRSLWDEAIQVGEGAVFVDVYSYEVHGYYARALAMKGRYKDAHDEIDGGLAAKPKPEGEAMLRVERARIFGKEKQLAKAKTELDAALKLDPKNAEAAKVKSEFKL